MNKKARFHSNSNQIKMENLPDDLLMEILSRVPCKSVVRCKSISKSFLALISRRDFIEQFIYRYHTLFCHINQEDQENEWSLIFLSRNMLLLLFVPNIHVYNLGLDLANPNNQNQLSLSFLGPEFYPELEDPEWLPLDPRILGYSNGLLLCISPVHGSYHVCNPFTKDWVQLPPLSDTSRGVNLSHLPSSSFFEGFICEPYYHVEVDTGKVTLNNTLIHRFRVVLLPCAKGPKSEFEAVVFYSETGLWNTKLLCCPKPFEQASIMRPAIAHGGRLYFWGKMGLLAYDPFNNDRQCDILDYPSDSNLSNIASRGYVGASCGNIRISEVLPTANNSNIVSVWELKEGEDSDSARWHLLHRTPLPPLDGADYRVQVRAFHPYHADVVFFQQGDRVFSGNLKTEQFHPTAYGSESLEIIPLDLPWWPTPVRCASLH